MSFFSERRRSTAEEDARIDEILARLGRGRPERGPGPGATVAGGLIGAALALLLGFAAAAWAAFAVSDVYGTLVRPSLGGPALPFAAAFGLVLAAAVLTHQYAERKDHLAAVAFMVGGPAYAMLLAHAFAAAFGA